MKNIIPLFYITIFSLFLSCKEKDAEIAFANLRSQMKVISFLEDIPESEEFLDYRHFYSLNFSGILHNIGYHKINEQNIAVQYFSPPTPKATAIVVHGYYDHVAIEKNLIHSLLNNNYAIVAFDLPGHGFSQGEPAYIEDFLDYNKVLTGILDLTYQNLKGPYVLIGHSTGAAIILDKLLKKELKKPEKIVLVSPLIRSRHWKLSIAGNSLAQVMGDTVPRVFRKNSSDPAYIDFVKNKDPLQYKKVSLPWFKTLVSWNDQIRQSESSNIEFMVIQGTYDITVDWQYNVKFIKDKFPQAQIEFISGGNHQLYNESLTMRESVFRLINLYLSK